MKAKLKGKKLIIELPLGKPRPSHSGKTILMATTHGVRRSTLKLDGRTVCVTANAFCFPEDRAAAGARAVHGKRTRLLATKGKGNARE